MTWRKANASEAARGFVAIDTVLESIRLESGARVPYEREYYYSQAQLDRRAKRGGDVPNWYERDSSGAWWDWVDNAIARPEIAKVLPTLGSYTNAA